MATERGRRISRECKLDILDMERRNLSVGDIYNELCRKDVIITKQGIRAFLKHRSVTRRPRTVRQCHVKIRPIHKKFVNMWIAKNTEITSRILQLKLKDVFGVRVSKSTTCNLRKELGWQRSQGKYCQQISHKNKVIRKEWCCKVWKEREQFQNVIFTDESCIEMNANGRLFFHNQKQSGDFQRKTIKRSKPKHAYKVNVWGGISYNGRTPICIFTGIMDSIIYQGILQENLIPFIQDKFPDGFRLYQDNDSKHTSKSTQQWMRSKGIADSVMKTPASSLDLNPIENVWASMKHYLQTRVKPTKKDELIRGIVEFWETLTPAKCARYIDHIHRVIPHVILNDGEPTEF